MTTNTHNTSNTTDIVLQQILSKLSSIEDRLEDLEHITNHLHSKTDIINKKTTIIHQNTQIIHQSTKNMDQHISFVQTVYDNVKYPFYQLLSYVSPSYQSPLPLLPEDENATNLLRIDA